MTDKQVNEKPTLTTKWAFVYFLMIIMAEKSNNNEADNDNKCLTHFVMTMTKRLYDDKQDSDNKVFDHSLVAM
jgi:hypothetical protein